MNKDKINEALERIEKTHGIRVIYACLGGSREWGNATDESDWDVHFVYVHPMDRYLGVHAPAQTMTASFDRVEFSGWDVRKAAYLASKSNPTLLEWISSDTIYRDGPYARELTVASCQAYDRLTAWHAHRGLMLNQYHRWIQRQEGYPQKKWWAFARARLQLAWVEQNESVPPGQIRALIEGTKWCPIYQYILKILDGGAPSRQRQKAWANAVVSRYDNRDPYELGLRGNPKYQMNAVREQLDDLCVASIRWPVPQ